ncbi:hypothetical protein EV383_4310 [Pseudonocardia sediminis]|uniref:Uncharacterized protein n=1 Tax=Pseudonocardia sediminis TaxID=1397368 RepID=A0A4V2FRA2_PSEST|nr:hypothetical protein [Pseudonocardia sediminis]RZT87390.1 hypothetical protein EV383_4310 [Pseudonocardia sediminis]
MPDDPVTDDLPPSGSGDPGEDDVVRALVDLRTELEHTVAELTAAAERADELIALRRGGHPWREIVPAEEPPLIIERISRALDTLGGAGSRFRREEARALQREGVSITAIGKLFGVTRQRASMLVQDRPERDQGPGD